MRRLLHKLAFLCAIATSAVPARGQDVPAVALFLPEDGERGVELRPTLTWLVEPGEVTSYDIQLATNQRFSPVLRNLVASEPTLIPEIPLERSTLYFWRVRAVRDEAAGEWSESFRFTTVASGVGSNIVLITPGNGATVVPVHAPFRWSAGPPFDSEFDVEVYSEESDSLVVSARSANTTYRSPRPLEDGASHRWRVRGWSASEARWGPWTGFYQFRTAFAIPGEVAPVSPPNNSTGVRRNTGHEWEEPDPPAVSYEIEIRIGSPDADPLIFSYDELRAIIEDEGFNPSAFDTVYWRVRGINGDGIPGPFGEQFLYVFAGPAPHPSKVRLVSPDSGATGVEATTRFVWMPDSAAAHYEISYGLGDSPDDHSDTTQATSWQVEDPLEEGRRYSWRVRSVNADDSLGEWSDTWSFTTFDSTIPPPGKPVLLAPANGAESAIVARLAWIPPTPGAVSYRVKIDSDEAAVEVGDTAATDLLSDDPFEDVVLEPSTSYFWRVAGVNVNGVPGPWSDIWAFSTLKTTEPRKPPPGAPPLVSPSDGATELPVYLTLDWDEPDPGAVLYRVRIDTSRAAVQDTAQSITDITTRETFHIDTFDALTTYFWKVMGINEDGRPGPWSEIWSFGTSVRTEEPRPGQPDLVAPFDQALDVPLETVLEWTGTVPEAATYRIRIDSIRSVVEDTVVNTHDLKTEETFIPYSLAPGTDYFWKVAGVNRDGERGPWSEIWSFTAQEFERPGIPFLVSPENGQSNVPVIASFHWIWADLPAASYRVRIDSVLENVQLEDTLSTDLKSRSTFLYRLLAHSTTYYWKVAGMDANGVLGPWSEMWEFSTRDPVVPPKPPPGAPPLVSPSDGATNLPVFVTLDWDDPDPAADLFFVRTSTSLAAVQDTVLSEADIPTRQTFHSSSFEEETTYYWRVIGVNQDGRPGPWSVIWSFRTGVRTNEPRPGRPELVAPSDQALDVPLGTVLEWTGTLPEAATYRIKIDSIRSVVEDTVVSSLDLQTEETSIPYRLVPGTDYFWKVAGINRDGERGPWSEIWSFTARESVHPGVPLLLAPGNGRVDVPVIAGFRWTMPKPPASSFRVRIDPDPAKVEIDDTLSADIETQFTSMYRVLARETTYYWKVAGINNDGVMGGWSEIGSFTTVGGPDESPEPGIPILTSPADGTPDAPLLTRLAWQSADTIAVFYWVRFGTDPRVVEAEEPLDSDVGVIRTYMDRVFNRETTYYWKVRGVSRHGVVGEWSEMWRFATRDSTLPPPGRPKLVAPADGEVNASRPTVLVWEQTSPAAESYRIKIGSDVETLRGEPLVADSDSSASTTTLTFSSTTERTYYWAVVGINADGVPGEVSEIWSFAVPEAEAIPGVPELRGPEMGQIGVPLQTELVWLTPDPDAVAYRLIVDTDRAAAYGRSGATVDTVISETVYAFDAADQTTYYWSVRGLNSQGGEGDWSEVWNFSTTNYGLHFPTEPAVEQNAPNPFNPSTLIRYAVPDKRHVRLTVYDALGRPIDVLVDETSDAGYHTVEWRADSRPSGVYIYRFEAGDYVETRKMLLLR